MSKITRWMVWNEDRTEGAAFDNERDAKSALDGKHFYDARVGFVCISSFAEQWFESYCEDNEEHKCFIEKVTINI